MLTKGVCKLDQEHTLRKSFDAPGVVYRLGHAFAEDKFHDDSNSGDTTKAIRRKTVLTERCAVN